MLASIHATNSTVAITIDLFATTGMVTNVEQISFRAFGTGTNDVSDASASDTLWGGSGADHFNGRGGDDDIRGNGGDDVIFGGDGNDALDGGTGNDYLDGGTDADQMSGGAGNDTYVIDDAGDSIADSLAGAAGGVDTILSSISLDLNPLGLTLTGSNAIDAIGNNLDNVIIGNAANNLIESGDGNDTLVGGAGDDNIDGGAGFDTVDYSDAAAGITVNLALTMAQAHSTARGRSGQHRHRHASKHRRCAGQRFRRRADCRRASPRPSTPAAGMMY